MTTQTTTPTKRARQAPKAARENLDAVRAYLREITAELDELDPEEADWSNVGDLDRYREGLKDIADSLLKRGEYDGR